MEYLNGARWQNCDLNYLLSHAANITLKLFFCNYHDGHFLITAATHSANILEKKKVQCLPFQAQFKTCKTIS